MAKARDAIGLAQHVADLAAERPRRHILGARGGVI